MKEEILRNLISVINALNNIDVKGKQNLLNLGGSIDIIEEIYKKIQNGMDEKHAEGSDTDTPNGTR